MEIRDFCLEIWAFVKITRLLKDIFRELEAFFNQYEDFIRTFEDITRKLEASVWKFGLL
jgi:hypothetical protein